MPPILTRTLTQAARLPWWAALLSAAAAYTLLHPIARLRLPVADGGTGLAAGAFTQILVSAAAVAQLLIPLALLLIAAASAYAAWRRHDLFTSAAGDLAGGVLRGLSREECGLLLAEAFRRLGYRVVGPSEPGSSKSARIMVARDDKRFLVDYSHWRSWQVPAGLVEMLQDTIAQAGADGGIAVSSGGFGADAERLAHDLGIELADGRRVRELIRTGWDPFATRAVSSDPIDDPRGDAGDEDAKTAAGRALAALIRDEERDYIGIDPAPPPSIRPPEASVAAPVLRDDDARASMTGWGELPIEPARGRPPHRRLRPSQIADGIGMLVALALLWAGWHWLAALPVTPEDSPWGGLPISAAPDTARELGGAEGRAPRPLGEFHFGPLAQGVAPDSAAPPASETSAALMPKLSVWELEAAFNASYIPPPECANWQSSVDMARCGNHRMRTLRAFIEGGGKLLPAMRGESLAVTNSPDRDGQPLSTAPSWREERGAFADPGWFEDDRLEPIPPGALAVPFRGGQTPPESREQEPNTRLFDERPPRAPTWREEQASREAEGGGREQDRLFVTPEDAERDTGAWRGDWLRH